MKKMFLMIIIFLIIFISNNLYSHDFIWGISENELIRINGQPDEFSNYDIEGNKMNILIYQYLTFFRFYSFIHNKLVNVVEYFGPYSEPNDAYTMNTILISRLSINYNLIKNELNERGVFVYFKYGNDEIIYWLFINEDNKMEISIEYISPLFYQ